MCWQPCFAAPRPGTEFCDQCWLLLAAHPADRVRTGITARWDVPWDVLEDLTDDPSAPVAFSARDRLEQATAGANRREPNERFGSES